MKKNVQNISPFLKAFPLSYSQIYFSNSLWLGIILLIVSFTDLGVGVSGLIAIALCQICAVFFSFNRAYVFNGAYTFNALMVSLAMGGLYQFGPAYLAVLVIAVMFTFFLTVWLSGKLAAGGLPMLSLPFLITIWTLLLGLSNFSGLQLATKQVYSLAAWHPGLFTAMSEWVDRFAVRDLLHLYLRSLSAIFFQYNDLVGAIIAVALLFQSRIAFALSLYGFLIGYAFYHYFAGDFTPLIYSYIGFNFILTAIALGGFFIVPSVKSHLLLLFVVPVTALILSALHSLFSYFSLPLFSLPFNIVVVMMIGVLQMRYRSKGLELVSLQQYSPERNHYKSLYYRKRFDSQTHVHFFLPVIGEWYISQGHEGKITHKEEWKYAWDFDVRDGDGLTYKSPGTRLSDYYCYELPVVAPSAGWVVTVRDGVRDNDISDTNLEENWGNTVIIKHAEGLYSKLSHLKPYSIKVREGDYVRSGELLAACGSSGRSPEPHLHLQLQATPYIGSPTLRYPLAYFLIKEHDSYSFRAFDIPKQGATVRNITPNTLLTNAFGFIAGKALAWEITADGKKKRENWTVHADIYNKQYIYCNDTKAAAYFINDGTLFYFTDFFGSKRSFLYDFYLGCQKILLGCYKGAALDDWILPDAFFNPALMSVQDFLAPFYHFLEGRFHFRFAAADDYQAPRAIEIGTESRGMLFQRTVSRRSARIMVNEEGIEKIIIRRGNKELEATCVS